MLLAYVHEPNTFQAIAPLSELLADYHRDDLVKLIDRFLEQQPQLLDLLLTQSKTASQKDTTIEIGELCVNGKAIAQSVRASLESADEYDTNIARELRQFERQGEQYLNQGDYLNAGAIYEALLDAFDSAYDMDFDHEGELAELVTNYVENLGECLLLGGSNLDPVDRRKWYEQLLQVFFKDLDLGGIGYGENVDKYLTSATDDDEWDEIKDACLKLLEYTANSWTQERIIRLLSDRLSPQESIKLIQAKGSPEQRIAVYLNLGEYQQAQQIALKQYSYELMPIAVFIWKKDKNPSLTLTIVILNKNETSVDAETLIP